MAEAKAAEAATLVIVDTGPLVAYFNRRDQYHAWAVKCWSALFDPVVTCEAVISEAGFLLRDDGLEPGTLWHALERGVVRVDFDFGSQQPDLLRLLRKYNDQPISVADACLVRMAELKARSTVFTTAEDFRFYRRHGRGVIPLIAPFAG
jgi:predicted nucleic acid-binding protein